MLLFRSFRYSSRAPGMIPSPNAQGRGPGANCRPGTQNLSSTSLRSEWRTRLMGYVWGSAIRNRAVAVSLVIPVGTICTWVSSGNRTCGPPSKFHTNPTANRVAHVRISAISKCPTCANLECCTPPCNGMWDAGMGSVMSEREFHRAGLATALTIIRNRILASIAQASGAPAKPACHGDRRR